MRLLLRANSHRSTPEGLIEIASSPDTPRRERWQWDLRLCPAAASTPGPDRTAVAVEVEGSETSGVLSLTADPTAVRPHAELLSLETAAAVDRSESELVVLVVTAGMTLAEGRHLMGILDALVLAGDDPLRLCIEQASDERAAVAVFRLCPADPGSVAWVP